MASGKWEFAMTTDGDTHTVSRCITADKASEFNGDAKSGREFAEKAAKGRCTINSYEIAGETVSHSISCSGRRIDSTTTFHGDSSEGSLVTTSDSKSVSDPGQGKASGRLSLRHRVSHSAGAYGRVSSLRPLSVALDLRYFGRLACSAA